MGSGNYGVVFKARHSATNDWVAIKCLGSDPDGEGIPSTTLRELSLLRDLNHPNIIRYLNIIRVRFIFFPVHIQMLRVVAIDLEINSPVCFFYID